MTPSSEATITRTKTLEEVQVNLSTEGAEAIMKVDEYSFAKVEERVRDKELVPADKIEPAFQEFRKYLVLIGLGYERIGMPSEAVDQIWHAFILFTEDYMRFCEEVFGFYVHHRPNTSIEPIDSQSTQKFYDAYQEVFGEIHPIWGDESDECSGTTNCQDSSCHCDGSNCTPW